MNIVNSQLYYLRLLARMDSDIKISLTGESKWLNLVDVIVHPPRYPISSRTILRNELVLEIDDDSWETVRDGSRRIIKFLDDLNAHYQLAYSGNRSIHIHVFFKPRVDLNPGTRKVLDGIDNDDVRKEVKYYLMRLIAIETGTNLDMNLTGKHLIRLEGSINQKSGKPCSLIDSIPDEKPINYDVKIPESMPELWDISMFEGYLNEYLQIVFKNKKNIVYPSKYKPIENPERFIEILKPVYIPGYRHYIVFSLSGIFRKHGVDHETARELIKELANPDPTPSKTAFTVKEVYRQKDPKKIPGITKLSEIVRQEIADGRVTADKGNMVLNEIGEVLR